jgi:type I restriction enzyme, S subunit
MDGWDITTIGQICTVIAGQSPAGKNYNNGGEGLAFYQGKKDFGPKYIGPPKTWTTQITKEADCGDILMSVRAPVGPINFATQKICIGRGLAAIRAGELIDKEFLFYGLLHKQPEISGNEGAVFASINKRQIEGINFDLPPLLEQQRVVAMLDEAFAGIDAAVAHAEKNLKNAREVFDSYLNGVVEKAKERTNSKAIVEYCREGRAITYGVIKLGEHHPDGVPCLRTSNVRWLNIDTEGMKRISQALSQEYARTVLEGGEVLVNVRGTLGGVAVVPSDMAGWNISREVAVVPCNEENINADYLAFCIGAKSSQDWLTGVLKGAAYTGINLEDLRTLEVPALAMDEQIEVKNSLTNVLDGCRELETIYQQKLDALAELKQSILQKAFSGELTQQDVAA